MKVMLRVPTNGHLDRGLTRWLQWVSSAPLEQGIGFHSIDTHYSTAGPDHARNQIVEQFLVSDANYLWMIDDDVVPPDNVTILAATQKRDLPVLSGTYDSYNAELKQGYPQVYKNIGPHNWRTVPKVSWPREEFFKADAAGGGCLLIRREVLEKMPPPWFEFKRDERGKVIQGEDMTFFEKVGGLVIMQSYQCEHYKEMPMSHVRLMSETLAMLAYQQQQTNKNAPPSH